MVFPWIIAITRQHLGFYIVIIPLSSKTSRQIDHYHSHKYIMIAGLADLRKMP